MKRTKFAVIGSDVSKSPSPRMHEAAFHHYKLPYSYEAISIPPEKFNETMNRLKNDYAGLNITIPYKEHAVHFANHLSERVKKLNALNTLKFDYHEASAENTDVDGLLMAISSAGFGISPTKTAFIVGAGGAAKATIETLSSFGVKQFYVAGRDSAKTAEFIAWFKKHYKGASLKLVPFHSKEPWLSGIAEAGIFVNSVPLLAYEELPFASEIHFRSEMLVVDWNYLPKTTPWIKKALAVKGTPVYGYEILLYQGTKSFTFWTGMEAPVLIMKNALLEGLT